VSEYKVVNPATNETEREFAAATDAEIEQVLERSERAYQSWRATAKDERTKMLLRVAELYKERVDDLAALITREMGKPTREAKGEIQLVISIYRYYAEQGPALLEDVPLSPRAGGTALVRKEPVGPLLGIMPWNFPYYQVARLAAPNLMVGNTIILKHAPQCPESALAMEQIFHDAGLLDGAYINVFATNSQIADMIADPRVSGVSVTGSERAGAAVAEVAATSRRSSSSSGDRTRSSCWTATTSPRRSRPRSARGCSTPARRATRPSGSSWSGISTASSSTSSAPRWPHCVQAILPTRPRTSGRCPPKAPPSS
jgi:succinate-semialdehyde dehydrogenase/glutarate-semialdehyde dehydrogenase